MISKRDTDAPEEKWISERTPLPRKYIVILEDYKMCGQLDRFVYTLVKKI